MKELSEFLSSSSDFEVNFSAASIGAQGPDIFFFHRLLNRFRAKSRVGTALHRAKPADIMEAFADYCKFSPNLSIAKSYMYGFIMHYALDRGCHPYVYAMQEEIQGRNKAAHHSSIHNRIEMAIDTYMLSTRLGIDNPSDFNSAKTLEADYNVVEEISHLLSFVVPRVTTLSVTEKEVTEAIRDTIKIQKILRDKHGMVRPLLRAIETVLAPITGNFKFSSMIKPKDLEKAKKYANINNRAWTSPYDVEHSSDESVDELFESAKAEARLLIDGFNNLLMGYLSGYEITGNISFLTGTEVK